MIDYFQEFSNKLIPAFVDHLVLSGLSIVIAILLAFLLTGLLLRFPKLKDGSVYILSLIYAIPSFALLTLMIPIFGLGKGSASFVLILYAQYILVRSFLVSLEGVSAPLIEAAEAMGMTPSQVFLKVRLPLAKKGIFSGIRLATTSLVAIATIASVVNAGGLGLILFEGLKSMNQFELAWGIILTVGISLWMNAIIYAVEYLWD